MKNFKSINLKSVLTKSLMTAGLTFAGLLTLNLNNNNNTVKAATTANDPQVVTVNYVPGYGIKVWNEANTDNGQNGQLLKHNTTWKVTDSAYDAEGNKWYDLGLNQWVMAKYVQAGYPTVTNNAYTPTTANTQVQSYNNNYNYAQNNSQTTNNNTYTNYSNYSNYSANTASTSSYTSTATGSEAAAKAWIASKESGGSYTARNGQYIGKYQLSSSYLNGDYSAANQERVADNYVKSRYGSWTAAQSFWQANGWY